MSIFQTANQQQTHLMPIGCCANNADAFCELNNNARVRVKIFLNQRKNSTKILHANYV